MCEIKRLAKYVRDLQWKDLSEGVRRRVKRCALEWMGEAIQGSQDRSVMLLRKVILPADGATEAAVFGTNRQRAAALNAAFLNGAASCVSISAAPQHNLDRLICVMVMSPAFALAEKGRRSGRDFLTAAAAGIEVFFRAADAYCAWEEDSLYAAGLAGAVASAAAAGRVLELPLETLTHGMMTAGRLAGRTRGYFREDGTAEVLSMGRICYGGVLAALLAQSGFTVETDAPGGGKGLGNFAGEEPEREHKISAKGLELLFDGKFFDFNPHCRNGKPEMVREYSPRDAVADTETAEAWEESRERFFGRAVPVIGEERAERLARLMDSIETAEDLGSAFRETF